MTIRHGYQPLRVVIVGVVAIAALAVVVQLRADDFRPSKKDDATAHEQGALVPALYAFDTFVPIVNFRRAERFEPKASAIDLRTAVWVTVALGWVVTTLFVAGFTSVVKNEERKKTEVPESPPA